ncbi:hypothetical protein U1Q18_007563 [Sarracenia purpurea var. burkii]
MMSKTCTFTFPSSIHHHDHHLEVSTFPTKSAMFSSETGYPSLKLSPFPGGSSSSSSSSNSDFHGRRFILQGFEGIPKKGNTRSSSSSSSAPLNGQLSTGIIGKAKKWWEKGVQPNMKEVKGAQDLVDALLNTGDKLVVVDFFSPGCGGCRALHPKICQFAEMNPDVQFLQVNYEEHKSMCYSLNVHVLPFFRFYRGAHGRLCSFSCTNATIKKFKEALAKHSPDQCSLGAPKGLEEKELQALAANRDLSFNYKPKPEQPMPIPVQERILAKTTAAVVSASHSEAQLPMSLTFPVPNPSPFAPATILNAVQDAEDKTLIKSG